MKSRAFLWLPVIAAVVVSACGAFKPAKPQESKEKPKSEAPKLVGRIASIPADKRFVLIQSYGSWNIETGTILTTRGSDERTANLLVTGESLGQFAAADLQSGLVEVGDAVYSRHVPKPTQPASEPAAVPELPEYQRKTIPENVQKNN
jgi:hypothetical protein